MFQQNFVHIHEINGEETDKKLLINRIEERKGKEREGKRIQRNNK